MLGTRQYFTSDIESEHWPFVIFVTCYKGGNWGLRRFNTSPNVNEFNSTNIYWGHTVCQAQCMIPGVQRGLNRALALSLLCLVWETEHRPPIALQCDVGIVVANLIPKVGTKHWEIKNCVPNFAGWLDIDLEKFYREDGIWARPSKMSRILPGAERVIRALQAEWRRDVKAGRLERVLIPAS